MSEKTTHHFHQLIILRFVTIFEWMCVWLYNLSYMCPLENCSNCLCSMCAYYLSLVLYIPIYIYISCMYVCMYVCMYNWRVSEASETLYTVVSNWESWKFVYICVMYVCHLYYFNRLIFRVSSVFDPFPNFTKENPPVYLSLSVSP